MNTNGRPAKPHAHAYNGLQMRCAPGTHEAVAELVRAQAIPTSMPVLDIAAGSGALLARLADRGFTQLAAIELDRPKFEFAGCVPLAIDLNLPFRDRLPHAFGLITAVEIIEHLDSPRAFLRELRAALTEDGWLVVSTPNVTNWRGRLKLLVTGELRYFDRGQYDFNHHISPITDTMMRLMLAEVGLGVVRTATAGRFANGSRARLTAPVDALARLAFGAASIDEVRIYLCRKADPKFGRPEDWT